MIRSPEIRRPESEAEHSLLSNGEVKKCLACLSQLRLRRFVASCLSRLPSHGTCRGSCRGCKAYYLLLSPSTDTVEVGQIYRSLKRDSLVTGAKKVWSKYFREQVRKCMGSVTLLARLLCHCLQILKISFF
jgi:hypothetical protein